MHAGSIVILRVKDENEIKVNNSKSQQRHQFVGGFNCLIFRNRFKCRNPMPTDREDMKVCLGQNSKNYADVKTTL